MSSPGQRSRNLAFAALPAAVFALAWSLRPWATDSEWTVCLWRTVTGKCCALCGLTRAFACAAHGDFGAAAHFHPVWWLFAAVITATGVLGFVDAMTSTRWLPAWFKGLRAALWPGVALLIVLSVVRWFAAA